MQSTTERWRATSATVLTTPGVAAASVWPGSNETLGSARPHPTRASCSDGHSRAPPGAARPSGVATACRSWPERSSQRCGGAVGRHHTHTLV